MRRCPSPMSAPRSCNSNDSARRRDRRQCRGLRARRRRLPGELGPLLRPACRREGGHRAGSVGTLAKRDLADRGTFCGCLISGGRSNCSFRPILCSSPRLSKRQQGSDSRRTRQSIWRPDCAAEPPLDMSARLVTRQLELRPGAGNGCAITNGAGRQLVSPRGRCSPHIES